MVGTHNRQCNISVYSWDLGVIVYLLNLPSILKDVLS